MSDPQEALPEKVNAIEHRLDALALSVDARFDAVDARFDAVDVRFDDVTAALVEQRQYTEFASGRLRHEMLAGFALMTSNFSRLERKLDQFIDTQSRTNALVERRLGRLEGPASE